MSRRCFAGLLAWALLALGAVHAELTGPQIAELRPRLDALADAIATGDAKQTKSAALALQRWGRQVDLSLPVDLLCDRATRLAVTDFAGDSSAAQQLQDSLRQLSGNLAKLDSAGNAANLADARAALATVLADREYQTHGAQPNWWAMLGMKLLYWVTRLFDLLSRIPGAEKIGSVGFYVVVALLLLPLLALIIYLVWRQVQQRRGAVELTSTTAVTALELPAVYLARAEELLQRGEYHEALKQFYLAVLATLEQRGWAMHDRTRTNWEYLAQLEARHLPAEATTVLRALNRIYDRAVYGRQPCDATLVREFSGLSRQLMQTPDASARP